MYTDAVKHSLHVCNLLFLNTELDTGWSNCRQCCPLESIRNMVK